MEIVRRAVPQSASMLATAGIIPALARVYAARGIRSPAELALELTGLPSWTTLKGIEAATERLAQAIARTERLLIIADYDADGATACALGVLGLRAMGAEVDFLVPNRFEFGYGLTPEIVALAAERRPRLIITVDNGIASVEGVAAAQARGIEVLITDHHLPGPELPPTELIVNPNQAGCGFPSRHLAGVGVMFYVLLALRARLRQRGHFAAGTEPNLAGFLDLVALGTVADVVTLDRLNRILVAQGLRRIRGGRMQPGVRALLEVAGRDPARATAYDLGFVVGPRLNAAGRLADMSIGIGCLIAPDAATAAPLAARLDALNRERREIESAIQVQALDSLADVADDDRYTVCAYRPEWHQGVIGIVASRLKDRFHRPAVVFARGGEGELRGSGRSIGGFHLRDALDLVAKRAPGTIRRFGGHAFAAGLTLGEDALARFADEFERVARAQLTPTALRRTLETDGELQAPELTMALARDIREEVWGQGFPAPLFEGRFDVLEQQPIAGKHLRLIVAAPPARFQAVVFDAAGPLPARVRVTYRPEIDRFQGLESLQLIIDSWQPD
ncbi:MAG TPA: single-stranded-DNA-specific exonuclease RecJ [Casimicrobiaceae bacterium]|nr:single-stranded-DNA-specific exonuclease RecJ [Casimicrobiaceae bacterium]